MAYSRAGLSSNGALHLEQTEGKEAYLQRMVGRLFLSLMLWQLSTFFYFFKACLILGVVERWSSLHKNEMWNSWTALEAQKETLQWGHMLCWFAVAWEIHSESQYLVLLYSGLFRCCLKYNLLFCTTPELVGQDILQLMWVSMRDK